jgi:hypothetical protein
MHCSCSRPRVPRLHASVRPASSSRTGTGTTPSARAGRGPHRAGVQSVAHAPLRLGVVGARRIPPPEPVNSTVHSSLARHSQRLPAWPTRASGQAPRASQASSRTRPRTQARPSQTALLLLLLVLRLTPRANSGEQAMPGDGGAAGRAMWVCAVLAALPFLAAAEAAGRYRAVFNFGDSLVDAGNLVTEGIPDYLATARLPYGQTYFGYPTGRCSDGRLVVDFIGKFRRFLASVHFSCVRSWELPLFGIRWVLALCSCSARVRPPAAAAVQGQERQLRAGRQLRHHRRHRARHRLLPEAGARQDRLELRLPLHTNPVAA